MPAKFEVYRDRRGEYRFRLRAANSEIILASQGYKSRRSCLNGVASVQKNAVVAERFDLVTGKSGKVHFVLRAGNRQVIGTSQTYSSTAAARNGIRSVGRSAPAASVNEVA